MNNKDVLSSKISHNTYIYILIAITCTLSFIIVCLSIAFVYKRRSCACLRENTQTATESNGVELSNEVFSTAAVDTSKTQTIIPCPSQYENTSSSSEVKQSVSKNSDAVCPSGTFSTSKSDAPVYTEIKGFSTDVDPYQKTTAWQSPYENA